MAEYLCQAGASRDAKQFDGVPNKLGAVLLAKCRSGEHVGDSRSAKNYPISSERPSHGQLRLSLHMRAELYDNEYEDK